MKSRINAAFPDAAVQVQDLTGTQDHYEVEVVCPTFATLSRIQRHRSVYAIFSDVLGGDLHALSLKLRTPDE